MAKVRRIIVRETAGAIMPRNQLLAVDRIMQMHHDSIAEVMSAARHNGGLLSPLDTFQLIMSVTEHITMASYWLQIAKPMPELPGDPPSHRDLSEVESRQKRLNVLSRIRSNSGMAKGLMDELSQLVPGNPQVGRIFDKMKFEIYCVQINSVIAAFYSASGGPGLSDEELMGMLSELDKVRLSPTFSERSSEEKRNLWLSSGLIYETVGDTANSAHCVSAIC